jgi:hypothetical protein
MGLQIEDGKGTGSQAQVENNMLRVSGVTSSYDHFANHEEGQGFNMVISATPTGAGDYFLYIKNENPETTLSITGLYLKLAADDYVQIELNDSGEPIGGNTVDPVNANTSSGKQALGIFQTGADITGLNGGSIFHKIYHANSAGSIYHDFKMGIVLGANGVMTMKVGVGTVPIECVLEMSYHGAN